MTNNSTKTITEWKPISELRQIEENISSFGYIKEFIEKYKLHEKKSPHSINGITGQVDFFEPIEVKEDGGIVFYRVNDNRVHMEVPEIFEMQYGRFSNHNNGEFASWLERDDFYIEGNFCDMFDCGEYSYAVSNLRHMGLGRFKIVRIDQNLEPVVMYDNSFSKDRICLEYEGRFKTRLVMWLLPVALQN